jgi:patatin-like phospholipase/acyl hydrolase
MSLIAYTQNGSGAGTSPDTNDQNVHETRGLFLLSLDGGGVKGLSTLYILRGIMNRLNDKREGQGLGKVKPCELFDLIAGTSTGG